MTLPLVAPLLLTSALLLLSAVWFQVLAGLNELMWRHITDSVVPQSARWFSGLELSEAFWANAKLGVIVLTLAFGAAQLPLIFKHQPKSDDTAGA